MASIRDLLSNRTIHYVQPEQTVFEAANYMVQCNVGAVPVLDGTRLVGIFSERDIMKRVVTEGRDPMSTRINDVMSTDLHTVAPTSTCHDAMTMMQEYAVRHLPVCEGSMLVGFLSLRDLLHQKVDETVGEAEMTRLHPDRRKLITYFQGALPWKPSTLRISSRCSAIIGVPESSARLTTLTSN